MTLFTTLLWKVALYLEPKYNTENSDRLKAIVLQNTIGLTHFFHWSYKIGQDKKLNQIRANFGMGTHEINDENKFIGTDS